MRVVRTYILLALLTAAPLLSALIAERIATAPGSKVDEAGSHPCFVHGVDIGVPLNIMFTAGWFAMLTIPIGCIAILGFTIKQVGELFTRQNKHG